MFAFSNHFILSPAHCKEVSCCSEVLEGIPLAFVSAAVAAIGLP